MFSICIATCNLNYTSKSLFVCNFSYHKGGSFYPDLSQSLNDNCYLQQFFLQMSVPSSIYGVHDEAKDKDFELEMSWVCDESNRQHGKVSLGV